MLGQSSELRADSLIRCRDRYIAAASALGSRGERPTRGRIRDSIRVCADAERVFEHGKARPVPYGYGTVA